MLPSDLFVDFVVPTARFHEIENMGLPTMPFLLVTTCGQSFEGGFEVVKCQHNLP